MKHIGDICRKIAKRLEIEPVTLPTDAYSIEKIFDELCGIVCVVARSGVGKTSFALDVALEKAVNDDKAVVIVTCEKSVEQITTELVMKLCGLNICFINEEKKEKLAQVFGFLSQQKIYLEGFERIEYPCLFDVERAVEGVDDVGLVMIDGLHCLWDEINVQNVETKMSVRTLKQISKKFNAPILITTYYARTEIKRMLSGDMSKNHLLDSGIDRLVVLYRSVVGTTMSFSADYLVADRFGEYNLSALHYDTKKRSFTREE